MLPGKTKKRNVQILENQEVFHRFVFRIQQVRLCHERFDGTMSEEIVRLNLLRGDSVAALLHDPKSDTVVLAEQFRYPTYENGPGWILEIPAGIVEKGEDPITSARREITEEVGYAVESLSWIASVYASPGGSSERIHIYYAPIALTDRLTRGGGITSEGEDIRIVTMTAGKTIQMLASGEIVDAKTVIALQWLQIQRALSRRENR